MFKPHTLVFMLTASALVGCQATNTTSGGAVGVDRKQYMFSMLSTEQVNQMYAQSYQQTLSEASKKGVLEKSSTTSSAFNLFMSGFLLSQWSDLADPHRLVIYCTAKS